MKDKPIPKKVKKMNVLIKSPNNELYQLLSSHKVLGKNLHFTKDEKKNDIKAAIFTSYNLYNKNLSYIEKKQIQAIVFIKDKEQKLVSKKEYILPIIIPFAIKQIFVLLQGIMETSQKLTKEIKIHDYTLYPIALKLCKNSREINLTEKEMLIIKTLAESAQPINKTRLLELVWGYKSNIDTHTLQTHIYRLRKKINDDKFIIVKDNGYTIGV